MPSSKRHKIQALMEMSAARPLPGRSVPGRVSEAGKESPTAWAPRPTSRALPAQDGTPASASAPRVRRAPPPPPPRRGGSRDSPDEERVPEARRRLATHPTSRL